MSQSSARYAFFLSPRLARQRGVSLLELVLVLGIVGAVLGGIFLLARFVEDRRQVTAQIRNAESISSGLFRLAASGLPEDLDAGMAARMGVFPESMVSPQGKVSTRWGTVSLRPENAPDGGSAVAILYAGVPSSACVRFVSTAAPGFAQVRVNGAVVKGGRALDLPRTWTACRSSPHVDIALVLTGFSGPASVRVGGLPSQASPPGFN